jgi:hypothetical protein
MLENGKGKKIFVFLHNPVFSTACSEQETKGDCDLLYLRPYEELFREYGVTMVFSGHVHRYERLYVPDSGDYTCNIDVYPSMIDRGWIRDEDLKAVKDEAPVRCRSDTSIYDGSDAITYIVSGGGGGPLEGSSMVRFGEPSSYYLQRFMRDQFHFVMIEVYEDQVIGRAISSSGEEFDTFQINN